jgi:multidrug efflux pump subunit AcrA (membrane-fusion protein)
VLDRATGQYYFEIRVRVGLDELARHEGFYLSPGMPADVTIVTGERTMLQYLLDPLARSLRSALVYD